MPSSSKPAASAVASSTPPPSGSQMELADGVWIGGCIYVLYIALEAAYNIRLGAINDYGRVIHEFDPYFNYRATEVCVHACVGLSGGGVFALGKDR